MITKATFKAGENDIKVNALHQWDYGQQLEIEAEDLPPIFEVHFACKDMPEAAVVSCSAEDGVGIVTIPNRCLEQSKPVTAWIYEIDGTQGTTTKTISIPIIARTRPSKSGEIPQDIHDKYTELIACVNNAIRKLESGELVVAKAASAANADYANGAGNASTAANASSATRASYSDESGHTAVADHATYSVEAGLSRKLITSVDSHTNENSIEINMRGLYLFVINESGGYKTGFIYIGDLNANANSTDALVTYYSANKRIQPTGSNTTFEKLALLIDTDLSELMTPSTTNETEE